MTDLIALGALIVVPFGVGARFYTGRTGHYNMHLSSAAIQTSIDCLYTYQTVSGDTCSSVAAAYSMLPQTLSVLEQMNPNTTCGNGVKLAADQLLCVSSPTDSANTTAAVTCEVAYNAKQSDTCSGIYGAFELSSTAFLQLNPQIDCVDSPQLGGQTICVEGSQEIGGTIVNYGGPTQNQTTNEAIVIIDSCVNSVVLSSSSTMANHTCVEFLNFYSNISATELVNWNTNLNCWNISQYSGQRLCIRGPDASSPETPLTITLTSTLATSTTSTTTTTTTTTTVADSPGSGTYAIKFTYYGNGQYASPSTFMCGNNGYSSSMPSDPTSIIAISQQLGLKLFSSYMTQSQIDSFENTASPMCLNQIQITSNGVTLTKTIYDVCDDTNGCATNDIDFWDPSSVEEICGGSACDASAYLLPIWRGY
ncbi:hypothetical protein HDU84_006213 [Entophlyctis sp. JEL0112]|nr:hypothetical protein HDU84_006213 [Entophlyctis sp. JEL0112]